MAEPQLLLPSLARAFALTEHRDRNDPEYLEALHEIREIQKGSGWTVVRVRSHGFSIGQEVVWDLQGDLGRFRQALEEAGIQELRFQEVLAADTLADFLARLRQAPGSSSGPPSSRFRGLEGALGLSFHRVSDNLPGMSGAIQELFTSPRVRVGLAGGRGKDAGAPRSSGPSAVEAGGVPEAREPSSASAIHPLEPSLAAALKTEVEEYLSASGAAKRESGTRIRAAAVRLREARNIPALGELVSLLAQPSASDPDPEAVDLMQENATPTVTSYLVAQLGASKDDRVRAHLTRVMARIGREGLLALADALGESRDRSQRRAYLDAMVRLGPLGLETARRMLNDPRWFVVRNGVSILGEVRGEGMVEDLAAPLKNEDARVRVAAVLALARAGGEKAESMILGMLGDRSSEVRATACRGLGVLRSKRAVGALESLLNDENGDVQVECLRALGHIGDPGPLGMIRKKAHGGFFSKPPREVRITAFRALAALGTFRALEALKKGINDRDKEVRKVVVTLLDQG